MRIIALALVALLTWSAAAYAADDDVPPPPQQQAPLRPEVNMPYKPHMRVISKTGPSKAIVKSNPTATATANPDVRVNVYVDTGSGPRPVPCCGSAPHLQFRAPPCCGGAPHVRFRPQPCCGPDYVRPAQRGGCGSCTERRWAAVSACLTRLGLVPGRQFRSVAASDGTHHAILAPGVAEHLEERGMLGEAKACVRG